MMLQCRLYHFCFFTLSKGLELLKETWQHYLWQVNLSLTVIKINCILYTYCVVFNCLWFYIVCVCVCFECDCNCLVGSKVEVVLDIGIFIKAWKNTKRQAQFYVKSNPVLVASQASPLCDSPKSYFNSRVYFSKQSISLWLFVLFICQKQPLLAYSFLKAMRHQMFDGLVSGSCLKNT